MTNSFNLLGIGLVLTFLLLNIADTIFDNLVVTHSKKVDIWDIFQGLLGYHIKVPDGEVTYLELSDHTLITTPLALQLLGVFYAITFTRIPLSFHTMVKPRLIENKKYITFFLKDCIIKAICYGVMLFFTFMLIANMTDLVSPIGSFNYQEGNLYLTLLTFVITIILMIIASSLLIFYMYLKNKGTYGILVVCRLLLAINVFDRNVESINLILFNKVNFFIDSLIFWSLLIIGQWIWLNRITFRQEEYND